MQGRLLGMYLVRQPTLTMAQWPLLLTDMVRQPWSVTVPLNVHIR
jgi:hypothetical protein